MTKEEIGHWFSLYCKRNMITKPTRDIVDDFISTYSIDIESDYLMNIKL